MAQSCAEFAAATEAAIPKWSGGIPVKLEKAAPAPLTPDRIENAKAARARLDEMISKAEPKPTTEDIPPEPPKEGTTRRLPLNRSRRKNPCRKEHLTWKSTRASCPPRKWRSWKQSRRRPVFRPRQRPPRPQALRSPPLPPPQITPRAARRIFTRASIPKWQRRSQSCASSARMRRTASF